MRGVAAVLDTFEGPKGRVLEKQMDLTIWKPLMTFREAVHLERRPGLRAQGSAWGGCAGGPLGTSKGSERPRTWPGYKGLSKGVTKL